MQTLRYFIAFALTCFMVSTSFAEQLHNFTEIQSAITNGKLIRIVIDFQKCTGDKNSMIEKTIGVFSPNEIQVTGNHIASSIMHFTQNDPRLPNTPVYDFSRYLIADDNNLTLTNQALNPQTYAPMTDKANYVCKLDESVKVYS